MGGGVEEGGGAACQGEMVKSEGGRWGGGGAVFQLPILCQDMWPTATWPKYAESPKVRYLRMWEPPK